MKLLALSILAVALASGSTVYAAAGSPGAGGSTTTNPPPADPDEMNKHLSKHMHRSELRCVAPAVPEQWKDKTDGKIYWRCGVPRKP